MLLIGSSPGCACLAKIGRLFVRCCCCPVKLCLRAIRAFFYFFSGFIKPSYLVVLFVACLFWGEFLVYWEATQNWYSDIALHNLQNAKNTSIRILLVGDPQLVGEVNELPVIGALTRWDADHFMQKTFSSAFDIAQPHVVVFVGDLLDEGGIATNESLARYSRRFERIFNPRRNKLSPGDGGQPDPNKAQFVAYWGDNDLQMDDAIMVSLMDEYRQRVMLEAFALGMDVLDLAPCRQLLGGALLLRHFDFLLTDTSKPYDQGCNDADHFKPAPILFGQVPPSEVINTAAMADRNFEGTSNNFTFKVLLSHYPVVGPFAYELMDQAMFSAIRTFAPQLVISAHTHGAVIMWCDNCLDVGDEFFVPIVGSHAVRQGDKPYVLPLPHQGKRDAPQPHIIVPTVSYRMGVAETGYGIMTLNPDQHTLTYSVFWNPHRYTILTIYVAAVVFSVVWLLSKAFVIFENSDYYHSFIRKKTTHLP